MEKWFAHLTCCLGLCAVAAGQTSPPIAQRLLTAADQAALESILNARPETVTQSLYEECRKSAQAHLDRRQHADALREFRVALAVARHLDNPANMAEAYRGIGLSYWRVDNLSSALDSYQKGLTEARLAKAAKLEGELLRGMAIVKRGQSEIEKAIEYDELSVAMFRTLGEKRLTAMGLVNLGVNYARIGDLTKSVSYYQQALTIGSEFPDVADFATSNLGVVAAQLGNSLLAKSYFEQCLRKSEYDKDRRGITVMLANLGPVYIALGEPNKAAASYDRGLMLAREIDDIRLQSVLLVNRASLKMHRNCRDSAIADLKEVLAIMERGQSLHEVSFALSDLAHLENAAGHTDQALAEAQRAVEIGQRSNSPELLWQAFNAVAECELARNHPDEARRAFEHSIEQVESWRMRLGGPGDAGKAFLVERVAPYHGLLNLLLNSGDTEAALQISERAKARQLLDVIRGGKAGLTASMTPEEKAEEHKLTAAASSLNAKLTVTRDPSRQGPLREEWEAATAALDRFNVTLYASHPGLASKRGDAAPIALDQMEQLLPDKRTLLLEYTVTEDKVHLFAISLGRAGKPELATVSAHWDREDLTRQVSAFQAQLESRDLGYRAAAIRLYRRLLGPVATQLAGKTTVVIVPDGPLWELSFHALVRPDGRHMLERQAVFYAPSLTFLHENRRRTAGTQMERGTLALGDPSMANLPRAAAEVREIARLYAPESLALTGQRATKETWESEAPRYRVLHIATHGVLNRINSMYSYLELAPDPDHSRSTLEAREIVNMKLGADLAVLSACETARGKVTYGEGLVGLSWAFLLAGTPTTIVSQWKVDSASTTELMLGFHRSLRGNPAQPSAAALREASLALLRSPQYQHPFYWAAFVLVGDGY